MTCQGTMLGKEVAPPPPPAPPPSGRWGVRGGERWTGSGWFYKYDRVQRANNVEPRRHGIRSGHCGSSVTVPWGGILLSYPPTLTHTAS